MGGNALKISKAFGSMPLGTGQNGSGQVVGPGTRDPLHLPFWPRTHHSPGLRELDSQVTDSVLRPHHYQKGLLAVLRLDAQHGERGRRRLRRHLAPAGPEAFSAPTAQPPGSRLSTLPSPHTLSSQGRRLHHDLLDRERPWAAVLEGINGVDRALNPVSHTQLHPQRGLAHDGEFIKPVSLKERCVLCEGECKQRQ